MPSTQHFLLQLDSVQKQFDAPSGVEPLQVLKNISLQIAAGESLAIVGPSGSGKSTLLNILGTLDRPTSGSVRMDGTDLLALDEAQLADLRNRRIGFVFQAHHLLPQCTLLENVLVPTLVCSDTRLRESAEVRAREWLARVGLAARLSHRPSQLSGGERQRVAVVRALINQPQLLLADEPTGALDRASAENLMELLLEINREAGVALVVVTHAQNLAERMGRVVELREGILREPVEAKRAEGAA